ncbi:hypothetical protein MMC26_001876 [Xylographa opegraphella]|nr:hypothetical protein [Xylographa opegraphella]
MGTRGYYAYRFRGRYYIFYRQYDCYPEGLGVWILETIPQDSKGYQPSGGQSHAEPSLLALLDDRLDPHLLPCFHTPKKESNIEYTYVVDLDREVFTMDNGIHFFLNKIPKDIWIESLGFDDQWERLAFPSLLPPGCIADLAVLRFAGKTTEEIMESGTQQIETSVVRPKGFLDFPATLRHGPLLMAHFWRFVTTSLKDEMPFILRGLTPDDFAFREIAFAFISIAAGLSSTLKVVDTHRIRSSSDATWAGIMLGDPSEHEVAVLSDLAVGHHAEGIAPGSAPECQTYWFQGTVIRLEADLTVSDRVEQAIRHAIDFAQDFQYRQEPFDVILLSIEHVILLHVVGINVQRTAALKLLDIAVHYPEHPGCRYLGGVLKLFMDAQNAGEEEDKWEKKEEIRDGEETKLWPVQYDGFFAMMHLFEVAALRSMAPEKAQEGVFPTEIYEMILKYVDDITYQVCLGVSRKFRRCCHTALRVGEGTVVHSLDPKAGVTQTWDTSRFVLSFGPHKKPWPYQVESYVGRYSKRKNSTTWAIVCGSSQRSTLLSKFFFLDYEIANSWAEVNRGTDRIENEGFQRRHQVYHENDFENRHYWKRPEVLSQL